MDYSMYYSYKDSGDILFVNFNEDLKPNRKEKKGRIEVYYHDGEIVRYNIYDIKDIVKIKNEGMFYYPNPALVTVINTLLSNAGVPTLEIKDNSGYFIGEIKEIDNDVALVTLGNEDVNVRASSNDLQIGDKVVVAKKGVHLSTGVIVKEYMLNDVLINGHLCINNELGIKENGELVTILDKDIEIGKDFCSLEAK